MRINWTSHTTKIEVLHEIGGKKTTDNQPKKQNVLWGPHNEKHIRTLCYSAENNSSKAGRQNRKRETKTNMGR